MSRDRGLNDRQRSAVTAEEQAVCVLAGAGSGKTRVITYRICDLVQRRGASPGSVLAVTFTNKAAREMRERVEQLLPGCGRRLTVATFHSACARLLREFGRPVGLSPRFAIYDEDDSARLLAQLPGLGGLKRADLKVIYSRIERWRNAGETGDQGTTSEFDVPGRQALELLPRYENALRRADACDFAGLLLELTRLLETDGPEARAIKARFRHLLVDEYQDSNQVQARLVFALGEEAASVTVVGDDDQSIYAWRGARADNLLSYLKFFPHARVVRLEENYRSTQTILDAAHAVICLNRDRLEKKLYTRGDHGARVRVAGVGDERQEAALIAERIEQHVREGVAAEQIAVLYRTNAQSRAVEEALRRSRRAYRVVGGVHFYGRKEIKDLLAYVRLAINPRSDVDLLRVLNVPARGIGDTSRLRLVAAAHEHSAPLGDLLDNATALEQTGLKPAACKKLAAFGRLLKELVEVVQGLPADEAIRQVALRSGLLQSLADEAEGTGATGHEARDRMENIEALIAGAAEFVQEARRTGGSEEVTDFLEEAALATDTDAEGRTAAGGEPAVTLMTLHAAKGLEFDAVMLCGLEEGLFPQARDGGLDDEERIAEERRLCYVGMTRARRHLTLTHAFRRYCFGESHYHQRSRFLDDIPAQLVARGVPRHGSSHPGGSRPRRVSEGAIGRSAAAIRSPAPSQAVDLDFDMSADFVDDDMAADFIDDDGAGQVLAIRPTVGPVPGSRVRHASFGDGVVIGCDGQGPRSRLRIRFRTGEKKVVARYVTLIQAR